MKEITREEIMTSPAVWNPSVLDDAPDTSQRRLRQFPSTQIEFTEGFYNMEGDVIVQKTDIDDNSLASNNSSTSSGRGCANPIWPICIVTYTLCFFNFMIV